MKRGRAGIGLAAVVVGAGATMGLISGLVSSTVNPGDPVTVGRLCDWWRTSGAAVPTWCPDPPGPTTTTVPPPAAQQLVTNLGEAALRNDFTGAVGFAFRVGTTDVTVTELGRFVHAGNSQDHRVRLASTTGADVAVVVVQTGGRAPGTFTYAPLAEPVRLPAGGTYFLVSEEQAGGDRWFDYPTQAALSPAVTHLSAAYAAGTSYVSAGGPGHAYGVPNLRYSSGIPPTTAAPTTAVPTTVAPTTSTRAASTTTTRGGAPNTPLTEQGIREALARGGEVRLPAGTVNISRPLRMTVSGTRLVGAGRDATVLRMAFGDDGYGPLLAIPAEWSFEFGGGNPPPASMRVSDVEVAHLTVDGAREGNPNTYGAAQATTLRFGIQSTVSTSTWIHDVRVRDVAGDAIGFGNGSGSNVNPRVEDVLIERAGRNGVHLGHSEGAAIRRTKILDTPGVYWADAGAGNGIDIEVEGQDPSVRRTVIEDNEITRPNNPGFAGFGIQVTRAFGDVDDVLVRRNTFRNHQLGVLVSTATNVRVLDNRFESSPAGVNNVTGGGVGLIAHPGYPSDAVVAGNVFELEPWGPLCDNVLSVTGEGLWRVADNTIRGCLVAFKAYGDPSHLTSERNRYKLLSGGPIYDNSAQPASTFSDVGSARIS